MIIENICLTLSFVVVVEFIHLIHLCMFQDLVLVLIGDKSG
jgi:hypothetical protein